MPVGIVISYATIFCIADLYLTGNRIFTLQILVISFVALLVTKRYKIVTAFLLLSPIIGEAMKLFRWVRGYLHETGGFNINTLISSLQYGYSEASQYISSSSLIDGIQGITESVNFNTLVFIVRDFGDKFDYLYGISYLKSFFFFVPRSIWPDKPNSLPVIIGDIYCPNCGVAFITTALGEAYANFGFISLIIIPLVIIIITKIDRSDFNDPFACALKFIIGFTASRMAMSDVVIAAIFAMIARKIIVRRLSN